MEHPLTAWIIYTASALVVAMFADTRSTTRAIFKKLENISDRQARLEQRCADTHGKSNDLGK